MKNSTQQNSVHHLKSSPIEKAEHYRSGVKIINLGITPTGKSILSDVESLLSQYDHREMVEKELQAVLKDLARRILARTIG